MSEIPEELLYTREHEWIRLEGSKGEVGITAYAQQSLGDIVYVELPSTEDEIDIGDEFGTIESVKAVSSLFMPATGRILEVNGRKEQAIAAYEKSVETSDEFKPSLFMLQLHKRRHGRRVSGVTSARPLRSGVITRPGGMRCCD